MRVDHRPSAHLMMATRRPGILCILAHASDERCYTNSGYSRRVVSGQKENLVTVCAAGFVVLNCAQFSSGIVAIRAE